VSLKRTYKRVTSAVVHREITNKMGAEWVKRPSLSVSKTYVLHI